MSEFAMRDSDVANVLSAACDATDLQLTAETLSFVIHLLQRHNQLLLDRLRTDASFIDFFALLVCPDYTVLSKVVHIFVLLIKLGSDFLRPYDLNEWVSGIMNTIVAANIDLQFVKSLYACMIERPGTVLSSNARFTIVHPQLIPLFLLSLLQLDEVNIIDNFTILIEVLKVNFSVVQQVEDFDHPWLLMLMSIWPREDAPITEVTRQCYSLNIISDLII
jgi:hypothetical protein